MSSTIGMEFTYTVELWDDGGDNVERAARQPGERGEERPTDVFVARRRLIHDSAELRLDPLRRLRRFSHAGHCSTFSLPRKGKPDCYNFLTAPCPSNDVGLPSLPFLSPTWCNDPRWSGFGWELVQAARA